MNKKGGCGPIALGSIALLSSLGWTYDQVRIFDQQEKRVERFATKLSQQQISAERTTLAGAVSSSDVVLFATSATTPHVDNQSWLAHNPTIIHLSLRDLSPNLIWLAQNVADDIDHCLKADTSLHLTEKEDGNRDFINLSIADLITGRVRPDPYRPRIYSPFGMGILDLAVARAIFRDTGPLVTVDDFFPTSYVQALQ